LIQLEWTVGVGECADGRIKSNFILMWKTFSINSKAYR